MKTLKWLAIGTAACLLISFRATADVLYNNSVNNTGYALQLANGVEVGDEINLASSEYLTNFSFNFYSSGTYADVTLEILFQLNDGTPYNGYNTPGTVIYDSGAFTIASQNGDGGLSFDINDLSLNDTVPLNSNTPMPTDFTFSLIVSGLGDGDVFSVDLYNPPTVGGNYGDYWLDNGGSWELLTNSETGPIGFASLFQGSVTPAPEPAAIAISLLSGAALLLALRRRRP